MPMLVWGLLAADMRRHPRPKARTEFHAVRTSPRGTTVLRYSKSTCYDMATYPCIYVYDAPGINPSTLWQLWSWNFIFLSWD